MYLRPGSCWPEGLEEEDTLQYMTGETTPNTIEISCTILGTFGVIVRNFDWDPSKYTTPFTSEPTPWRFNVREHDNSDLSINRHPEGRQLVFSNAMSVEYLV